MLRFILIVLISFIAAIASAQSEKQLRLVESMQDSLITLRKQVLLSKSDKVRNESNALFKEALLKVLSQDASYYHTFELPSTGDLKSPDEKFRMITWNVPKNDGTHVYHCLLQVHDKEKKDYALFDLEDKSATLKRYNSKTLSYNNWYGALYYEIIPKTYKRKTHYVLLGWDGNNEDTNKKIIESLTFTSGNIPKFGHSIFKTAKRTLKRIEFEYSADATMSVKYEQKRNQIVFDHLAPTKEELKGVKNFYVPDLTFDALEYHKGKWTYLKDVDIRMKSGTPFNHPKDLEKKERDIR